MPTGPRRSDNKVSLESLISRLEVKARTAATTAAENVLGSRGKLGAKASEASSKLGEKQAVMRAWWADQLARRASMTESVHQTEPVCEEEEEVEPVFRIGPPRCVGAHDDSENLARRLQREWRNPTSDPRRQ
jgi:hypothetical protein